MEPVSGKSFEKAMEGKLSIESKVTCPPEVPLFEVGEFDCEFTPSGQGGESGPLTFTVDSANAEGTRSKVRYEGEAGGIEVSGDFPASR